MLAQDDKVMTDAVSTIYDITQDSILRQEIRARDERIALENHLKNEADKAKREIAEIKQQLEKRDRCISEQSQQISKQAKRIAELEEALRQAQK